MKVICMYEFNHALKFRIELSLLCVFSKDFLSLETF